MNYRRIYDALIEQARQRELAKPYERHHIVPRSLGGSNDASNIVRLTYREHFLAHWLLTKTTTGEARSKMCFAMQQMIFGDRRAHKRRIASWQYVVAKKAFREIDHPMRGRVGELSPQAKLTERQVRFALLSPKDSRTVANELGVTQVLISAIRRGKLWPHIFKEVLQPRRSRYFHSLTNEQAKEIFLSKVSERKLAGQYGVSRGTISRIKQGRTYQEAHRQ